jgi:lycopene cyclase domain-containing protein
MGRLYLAFGMILIPFFIVNGILTGSFIDDQVVWYNNDENLGIRIGTIPLEDTFYALLLFTMNVSLYEWLRARSGEYYSLY